MFNIDPQIILIVCFVLAMLVIGIPLWQQRAQKPITPQTLAAAFGSVPSLAKQYFDMALIAVHFIEQISKPAAPGEPSTLTNEEKKAQAMGIVKREFPDAKIEAIDIAVEAAVHAAKSPPAPTLTFNADPAPAHPFLWQAGAADASDLPPGARPA